MALLDAIGEYLEENGIVDGSTGWKLQLGMFQDMPDKVVSIFETGGEVPETTMAIDYPTFQVRVRGEKWGYQECRQKIQQVYTALHEADIIDTSVSPNTQLVYCYAVQSAPLSLGNDSSERPNLVQNFRAMKDREQTFTVVVDNNVYTLDNFTPGLAGSYSLRRLRKDYAGSAIRVRNGSTGVQRDIGFDTNGDLDTATLSAFAGSADVFVVIWYDQSGKGKDAIQSSPSRQPQIVSSGTILTGLDNAKPAIEFNGSTRFFDVADFGDSADVYLLAVAGTIDNVASQRLFSRRGSSTGVHYLVTYVSSSALQLLVHDTLTFRSAQGGAIVNNIMHIAEVAIKNTSTDLEIWLDGISVDTDNLSTGEINVAASVENQAIGIDAFDLGSSFNGRMQEIIVYHEDKVSIRSALYDDVNAYY